jgi:hypothetical protein
VSPRIARRVFGASLVFHLALEAARGSIAAQPFAFTIGDATKGLAAIVAAVSGGGTRRGSARVVTSGAIAKILERIFAA